MLQAVIPSTVHLSYTLRYANSLIAMFGLLVLLCCRDEKRKALHISTLHKSARRVATAGTFAFMLLTEYYMCALLVLVHNASHVMLPVMMGSSTNQPVESK